MLERKLKEKLKIFQEDYAWLYPEDIQEYIEENFIEHVERKETACCLAQVYSELEVDAKSLDIYRKKFKLLADKFDLSCNILEVAAGRLPAFSHMIAKKQLESGKGTVTVIDPLLISTTPKYRNMHLERTEFSRKTKLSSYDLIIGLHPCDITETIIEQACENQKNFFVAMCGCDHSPFSVYDYFYSHYKGPEYYRSMVIEKAKVLAKEYDNGEIVVDALGDSGALSYPIIYNRK